VWAIGTVGTVFLLGAVVQSDLQDGHTATASVPDAVPDAA
jgi:hypothetical protein